MPMNHSLLFRLSLSSCSLLKIGLTWGHFSDGAVKCWLLYSEQCCRPSPAPRPLYFKY